MIPEVARTGKVKLRDSGFTVHFSVDNQNYSSSFKYYEEDKWKQFPRHLKRKLGEILSSVWVCCIPSEKKIITYGMGDADVDLLEYLTYQSQNYYRSKVGSPSIPDRPHLHVTKTDNDWSAIDLNDDDVGLYFSGGRDAFSTLCMLEDAGYNPHLQMHNDSSSWETGEEAREDFMENRDRHIDTVWNNLKVTFREVEKDHRVFMHHLAPKFWLVFFSSLPLLEHKLQFFGNEATTTRYESVGKDRVLHASWQQSMVSCWMMTKWARGNGIDLGVGSILREMGDYRVLKEIAERRPDYWDISHSCFFVDVDNDYQPCSKCHKDFRNWMILEALDMDHPYDSQRLKQFEIDPAHLMWKTMLPKDLAHINHLNGRLVPEMPAEKNIRMEGLTFHPERANPSHFMNKEQFLRIYESVMDDDSCWLPKDVDATYPSFEETSDLERVWETISEWDFPFKYMTVIKSNNSLLDV